MITQSLLHLEGLLVNKLGWPSWALRLIAGLSVLVTITGLLEQILESRKLDKESKSSKSKSGKHIHGSKRNKGFRWLQFHYLSVYFITMLADWLQGTNMYTLYSSYGLDVGTLFLTGFLSSAVFGTFLGIYVDTWGRKFGCIIFCLLEIVINLLEHVPNMTVLLAGRVLGGLSTSLLFTAFESWMVSEHRSRGFDEDLLDSTFSLASAGNGLMAIFAGILAQLAADVSGDIGPFQLAIALTVLALVLILPWAENYGEHSPAPGAQGEALPQAQGKAEEDKPDGRSDSHPATAETGGLWGALAAVRDDPLILCLGLSQACFEGGVYTFVFMWVPSLLSVYPAPLPTGLIFSAFMLALTWGGLLSPLLLRVLPHSHPHASAQSPQGSGGGIGGVELLLLCVYILSAAAFLSPLHLGFSFPTLLAAFLVVEMGVGMNNSLSPLLRARYLPPRFHSSLLSLTRLPLNLLVVLGTRMASNSGSGVEGMRFMFTGVAVMIGGAALLQAGLVWLAWTRSKGASKEKTL